MSEGRRKKEAEPDIKLLIAKVNGVVRLFLSICEITIYQEHGYAVWNVKTLPELPFKKKFNEML